MDLAVFAATVASAVAALRLASEYRRAQAEAAVARLAHPVPPTIAAAISGHRATDVERFPVAHLRDQFPDRPHYSSPLATRKWPRNQNFVGPDEEVIATQSINVHPSTRERPHPRAFLAAGPLEKLFYEPSSFKAAIVTCGGLCPGLNTIIRELVNCLTYVYGVPRGSVLGVRNGYRGFYAHPLEPLLPEELGRIHTQGGSILGSSRGGFDADRILAAVAQHGLDAVFVVGGDGTHRGALALLRAAAARGVRLSVAGVPKTIDNDIPLIDRSFGFDTAVEEAVHPLNCAHTEALAAHNGVGLVKLMGRASGFIALHAALASRDVNVVLLPEAPWRLAKLLPYLESRLEARGHCLIVVAEGAEAEETREAREEDAAAAAAATAATGVDGGVVDGADATRGVVALTPTVDAGAPHANGGHGGAPGDARPARAPSGTDESGNPVLADVGEFLRDKIAAHFKARGKAVNIKYIDPSYIIRAAPACASDSNLCTALAFAAVHGVMAGRTGFSAGACASGREIACTWWYARKLHGAPHADNNPRRHC